MPELVAHRGRRPSGDNKVVKVAPGQFVELAFEGEDQILTLLGEFGDGDPIHTHGGASRGDAFAHNQIPEPDRTVDNTTIWTEDFNQAYYDSLLYDQTPRPSMANWYLEQSSGRYRSTATSLTGSRSRSTTPTTASTTAATSSAPGHGCSFEDSGERLVERARCRTRQRSRCE